MHTNTTVTYNRGVYDFGKPVLRVSDPVLIKQILVKDFHKFRNRIAKPSTSPVLSVTMASARDGQWKRIRAIASPAFTSAKLKHMYPLVNECCRDFLAALHRHVSTSGRIEVELKHLMSDYTIDVIASVAFATKTNPYSDPNNPFITKAKAMLSKNPMQILLIRILPTFAIKSRLWKAMVSDLSSNVMFFIEIVRRLMSERKKSDYRRRRLCGRRCDVWTSRERRRRRTDEGVDELMAEKRALSGVEENKFNENEILAQCYVFFNAGFETTATALSYCTYELAVNPHIQDQLVAETREAFSENTTDIDYETLCRLPLLDAVVSETLRKYPPLINFGREAMDDVVLTRDSDGSMFKIEKGMNVSIPVYALHHDPDYYPDPFAFKPDRFLAQNGRNIKPYTYLPFGAGPRNCIGTRFALLVIKLALVKILKQFRFYAVPDTDIPVIFNVGVGVNQLNAKRLVVGVEKR
ncbi:unnamed protein product [Medioppia subpectinata]|uniref:Cytochrome P450 n=1 Tax=Medioppia subpectinata TaxID=1979941 RepID=A0A7R9KU32_9ACAR|nr:unnamed protein product [Medioppia subpectinata]CAG2109757.1 unnamed protein product [Medioppia subpectinata]